MPSVEIVSIGCKEPAAFAGSEHFGVLIEKGTESHHNLFKKELEPVSGCIAHIGNKDQENDKLGTCFASDLIEWDDTEIRIPEIDLDEENEPSDWGQNQGFYYELKNDVRDDLKKLFQHMLSISPNHEILYFTRWQFGPEVGEEFHEMNFDDFWSLHACEHLRWNTLYRIKKQSEQGACHKADKSAS